MGKGRRAQDRHDKVEERNRERQRHQAACKPDLAPVVPAKRGRALAPEPSRRRDLEILAPEQKAVQREEDHRRQGRQHEVKREGETVREDEQAEKPRRVGQSRAKTRALPGRQARIVLGLDRRRHLVKKERDDRRGDRDHQKDRGNTKQKHRAPAEKEAAPAEAGQSPPEECMEDHEQHRGEPEAAPEHAAEARIGHLPHSAPQIAEERGGGRPRHALTRVTIRSRSGRGRSGGVSAAVPRWTIPAAHSPGARPKLSARSGAS